MRRYIVILFLLLFVQAVFAQGLDSLRIEISKGYELRQKRIDAYIKEHNIQRSYHDLNGNRVLLVDVSENGFPTFITTFNAGAAKTTGASELNPGGSLGLNLQGEGITVGIWDAGLVDNHIEFGDRILSTQGSEEEDHATHVTGTILATGINASAKGMAPLAKALTFDFDNDESEMVTLAKPDETGLLLSNHSYGTVTGWRFDGSWQWLGNQSISSDEDYRFGFYSTGARSWDQISFNAPYYLICKSAGNDRNDSGDGSRPADCNGGEGFDCITDKGNAKNILTVGAVNKVTNYTGPSSVLMSAFSAWGPTDDGRIKPDIVAAGVGLFSTIASETNDQYNTSNGTSMSAPNATGSLVLVQELYKSLHGGMPLKSATLKALAIHATKEAGTSPGPDYKFGWGLLDVAECARVILKEDGLGTTINEFVLTSGEQLEIPIQPKEGQKLKATIVWTDRAGSPVAASLDPTDLMLVNDLDLRLVDDLDNEQMPWILDPADPNAPATTGDNFRDNVEKLEYTIPVQRNYKIVVKHKGVLQGAQQAFSLILEYVPLNDNREIYYWIGDSGNWTDGSHWSLTSGGAAANSVPGPSDRVFVDENSFTIAGETINLNGNAACGSLTWLSNKNANVDFNGNELAIDGNIIIAASTMNVPDVGSIHLAGAFTADTDVNLGTSDLSSIDIQIETAGNIIITGSPKIKSIDLIDGSLDLKNLSLELQELISISSNNRALNLTGAKVSGLHNSEINEANLALSSSFAVLTLAQDIPATLNWQNITFEGQVISSSQKLTLIGGSTIGNVTLNGDAEVHGSPALSILKVSSGSVISLGEGTVVNLTSSTQLDATDVDPITISAISGVGSLSFSERFKTCFDHLVVDGVNITGDAYINAGTSSTISNSENWFQLPCDELLFPDFDYKYTCEGGLTFFIDKSSGNIDTYAWDFGDGTNSSEASPRHPYVAGSYTAKLTVSNESTSLSFERPIIVTTNSLLENHVIISGSNLFSFQAAPAYQWYLNDEAINSANARNYIFGGNPGTYYVIISNDTCNRSAEAVLITSIEGDPASTVGIFPNPVKETLTITDIPGKKVTYTLTDSFGRILRSGHASEDPLKVSVQGLAQGLYFLTLKSDEFLLRRRIIVE